MRKVLFEKSVQFCKPRISKDPKESQETEDITEPRRSTRQTEIATGRMFARRPEFLLQIVTYLFVIAKLGFKYSLETKFRE